MDNENVDSENAAETTANAADDVKESCTVGEALELICERGTGNWVMRVCISLSLSMCVQGLESNVTVYVASCFQTDFHAGAPEVASLAAANYAGQVVGSLLLCPLGDIFGRRICLIYYNIAVAICAVLSALAPDVATLIFFRAAVGVFQGPCILGIDYVMEVVPLARRGMLTNYVCTISWGVGTLLINALAYMVLPHYGWRPLLAITAIPFIGCVATLYYLVESPRWLASQGRKDDAFAALEKVAEINGTTMPCRRISLVDETIPLSHAHETNDVSSFFKNLAHEYEMLFMPDNFPTLWFLIGQWFTGGFAYSAVVLYQGDILGGETSKGPCRFDYGFNIIVGASEILGGFIMRPFIDKPQYTCGGRRGTQVVGFFFCGVAVLLAGFGVYPVLFFACIARALINGSTGVQNIQGPEVLDVSVRGTGSGFLNTIALIGSTMCSYWVYQPYHESVIAIGIAIIIFASGFFTYFVPETALTDLDTSEVYEIESLGDGEEILKKSTTLQSEIPRGMARQVSVTSGATKEP